ncbi:DUF3800 domain-containing protein [Ferrimonas gelatinilytica]|uniref:DUF3800 domain-containing protein n=1 Tax=Ferrimonas gelatinilytica TaxID=1255257 RepID=A0ABP9S6F2_9GAMM
MSEVIAYADESGVTAGSACYTIGVLNVPSAYLDTFETNVAEILERNGIRGEAKWQKVRKSAGQVNACIELLKLVLSGPCSFHCIAVEKSKFRRWQTDEETAFFMTYNFLLSNSCRGPAAKVDVKMDQKSTSYAKQDEVVHIITNHMLAKIRSVSSVNTLEMVDSKDHLPLQVVDMLTGAVNCGYLQYLDPSAPMAPAKRLACKRMAALLGFTDMASDTYPNDDFNIWHFPVETRAKPRTEEVTPKMSVSTVSRSQYDAFVEKAKSPAT